MWLAHYKLVPLSAICRMFSDMLLDLVSEGDLVPVEIEGYNSIDRVTELWN